MTEYIFLNFYYLTQNYFGKYDYLRSEHFAILSKIHNRFVIKKSHAKCSDYAEINNNYRNILEY